LTAQHKRLADHLGINLSQTASPGPTTAPLTANETIGTVGLAMPTCPEWADTEAAQQPFNLWPTEKVCVTCVPHEGLHEVLEQVNRVALYINCESSINHHCHHTTRQTPSEQISRWEHLYQDFVLRLSLRGTWRGPSSSSHLRVQSAEG